MLGPGALPQAGLVVKARSEAPGCVALGTLSTGLAPEGAQTHDRPLQEPERGICKLAWDTWTQGGATGQGHAPRRGWGGEQVCGRVG